MRLIGLLLLFAVLFVGWRTVTAPQPAPIIIRESAPALEAPQVAPAPTAAVATQSQIAPIADECRATSEGYLAAASTFGAAGSAFVHADYWTPGEPERAVILPGGVFVRPSGFAGFYWVYTGNCAEENVRGQVQAHMERRSGHGGWGDPSLFTRGS